MAGFRELRSKSVVLAQTNIDTDQIIPARFLSTTERAGLGRNAFNDWRWQADGSPNPAFPFNQPENQGRRILLAGPLLAMAWLYAGRPRRPLLVIAGLLTVVGGGILAYNSWVYGNPLKVHSLDEAAFYRQPLGAFARGLSGFFFDGAFGLFAAAPIWMLLVPAVCALWWPGH